MLEVFDGFIAALNTETKMTFVKEADGKYSTNIEFEEGRNQTVYIELGKDESDDVMISLSSTICELDGDKLELYKYALNLNISSLTYGAIALKDNQLIIYRAYFLTSLDPQRFIKSLLYVAARADELEEAFANSVKFSY